MIGPRPRPSAAHTSGPTRSVSIEPNEPRPVVTDQLATTDLADGSAETITRGATAAQLRRFIKSRPYVPLHELRRRFELNGQADDVCPVQTPQGIVFVGLPRRECMLLGELVRAGDVGVELCRDPSVPIVVGVFPMRPVART